MGVDTVIDAAITFDDGQIAVPAMGGVGLPDTLRINQESVQILTGPFPRGQ